MSELANGRALERMDGYRLPDEPAIRAHLSAHGVDCGPTETRYGARGDGPSIYIRDPEGNVVELKGLSASD